jgi:hypothetical protein
MSFIRPEVAEALQRWREVIAASAVAAVGAWMIWHGGVVLSGLGLAVLAGGAAMGWIALRRLRFARGVSGPGVVEIDEGQVGWFGPGIGGFVALAELADLGLVTVAGQRCWRLRQGDGQMLLIPVAARGAEGLYDAFAVLPGLAPTQLIAALDDPRDRPVIWRREARLALH